MTFESEFPPFGMIASHRWVIGVSINSVNRRDSLQRSDDVFVANISGMKDRINTFEDLEHLGAELIVRV